MMALEALWLLLHCLFSFFSPPRLLSASLHSVGVPFLSGAQVADVRKAPDNEVLVLIHLPDAAVAQLDDLLRKCAQFFSNRSIHAAETYSPRDDKRDQVRDLDSGCQVAVHEQG